MIALISPISKKLLRQCSYVFYTGKSKSFLGYCKQNGINCLQTEEDVNKIVQRFKLYDSEKFFIVPK